MLSRLSARRLFLLLFLLAAMVFSAFIADAHAQDRQYDVNDDLGGHAPSAMTEVPSWAQPRATSRRPFQTERIRPRGPGRNDVDLPSTPNPVPVDQHLIWLMLAGFAIAVSRLHASARPPLNEPTTPS